ncbi:hypothetical protein A3770_19p84120 [Chloropicon primus]|uniref:Uncharacterized protein n=1 Tax=Chloropicon primus TaxID=1764295 RepID=A0A5B8N2E2_9CHLO|nr:hypothetical protein A3770_19p84120 [Chloropicon primus]|eukprot:QDZ25894.1 hypothetical protein A3770_19p84120 [Chloropicon primus]
MLPTTTTTSNGNGHHYHKGSYGSVNQFSKIMWSLKKFFRHVKARLSKESKIKLIVYAIFLLVNVAWLGSTLMGLGSESGYDTSPGVARSGRKGNVWGTAEGKSRHGQGGQRGRGDGQDRNRSDRSASKRNVDDLVESKEHWPGGDLGGIAVNENVIRARTGEQISLAAKVVHINTRKDAGSDLVIEGGSIRFSSVGKELRSILCTQERRGTIVYLSGTGPDADQMVACLRASTGTFEWKALAGSGSDVNAVMAGSAQSSSGSEADLPVSVQGGISGISRSFDVGAKNAISEGQAVSFVGGKLYPGAALHLSEPLEFGKEDLLTSQGISGARKKIGLYPLSSKRFLLSYCNSVGSVYLQLGKFSGQEGVTESVGAILNKAKVVFSKGGKVDEIEILVLGEDRFIIVYTEYQSGGRLMAVAGEVLSNDVVSFGVPLEVDPKGARHLSIAPMGSNHIAVLFTRMKHHEDAKKGGCLVVLEHSPKFKHLDLSMPQGKCVTNIGSVIDATQIVNPSNNPQMSIVKDTRLVVAYRDMVSRNTVVRHVVVHDLSSADASKKSIEAGGGQEDLKFSGTVGDALVVHDYAVRLTDIKLSPISNSHVMVTYADKKNAGLILLDVSSAQPSVALDPMIFSNMMVHSLGVHVQDHRTFLVSYGVTEPVKLVRMIKVDINMNQGAGEMHMQESSLMSSILTHSQILSIDADNFLFGFLLGSQEEGGEVPGTGGILAGSFGHVIGVAGSNAAPGSKAPVVLSGVSAHHKGLHPGQCYYASSSGMPTISRTTTPIGLSVSDTEILLFAPGCRTD